MAYTGKIVTLSTRQFTWQDVTRLYDHLTIDECRVLELIARLPLVWVEVLQRLLGYDDPADVYRWVKRLKAFKLVGTLQPSLRVGHNPRLLYLTDLGLVVVAWMWQVEPADLAQGLKLRGDELLARIPVLPHLVARYKLLAALAAGRVAWPRLLEWAAPWRYRFQRPLAKAPVTVTVPAYATLAWGEWAAQFYLFPDLATYPLRVYRPTLAQLRVLRHRWLDTFPPLIIATTDDDRVDDWRRLLHDVLYFHRDAPLPACLTTWAQLHETVKNWMASCRTFPCTYDASPAANLPPLAIRDPKRSIPRLIGNRLSEFSE